MINNTFPQLGAPSSSTKNRAENDYYTTDPQAINDLFKLEEFDNKIWECACGNGVLSKKMAEYGKIVTSTDLINRGYGVGDVNFLEQDTNLGGGDIITNPPFKYIIEFIEQGLKLTERKLAIFARIQLLETKKRFDRIWSDSPLKSVNVYVDRMKCYPNGIKDNTSSAVCYAWYIWDKEYTEKPTINWIR